MAQASWPSEAHNLRAVTDPEYEYLSSAYGGEGVIGKVTDSPTVYANSSGREVWVRADKRAVVRGHLWYSGPTDFNLPVAANATNAERWDLIVASLDRSTWEVTAIVKTGYGFTPANGVNRTIAVDNYYQIPLARVRVAPGATSIGPGDVIPVEYYIAAGPIVAKGEAIPYVPIDPGRDLYDDAGNRYQIVGGQWKKVLTEDYTPPPTMRLVASWTNGGDALYWNGARNVIGWFGWCQFNADPSHTYQLSLDCKVRAPDPMPDRDRELEGVVRIAANGGAVLDSGIVKLTKQLESRQLHYDVLCWFNGGTVTVQAHTFKSYGDGSWVLGSGGQTWLRVYDLGRL